MRNLYILACDERGTRNWPSSSNTWAFGGYIIKKSIAKELIHEWGEIKIKLCGNPYVELKWSHFFPGNHQSGDNPLLSNNPKEWREQLLYSLDRLCKIGSFTPVTVISRKNLIPKDEYDFYFEKSSKGNNVLQDKVFMIGVIGLFAIYLNITKGKGEIWYDNLGSEKEQIRVQESWKSIRDNQKKLLPKYYKMTRRISPVIRFFDSSKEPLIQLADFLSGVIWAAAEGDESFLARYEGTYAFSPILKSATLVKMP